MDWVKTTARQDEKHLSFGSWCALYYLTISTERGIHESDCHQICDNQWPKSMTQIPGTFSWGANSECVNSLRSRPWFNIKDVVLPVQESPLWRKESRNIVFSPQSNAGKMSSLYWIGASAITFSVASHYLNKYWFIVNGGLSWGPWNKNIETFVEKYHLKMSK